MKYQDEKMTFMPVSLNLTGKEVLIVGGGKIAYQKIKGISNYTKNIRIVARHVNEAIRNLGLPFSEKDYEKSDLGNSFMVYACTNDRCVNQQVYDDANAQKMIVNVVDNPPLCDFVSLATYKKEHMTVSVGSNGQDVKTAIRWRDKIKDYLEENPID